MVKRIIAFATRILKKRLRICVPYGSPIIIACLFLISMTITPVVAQVASQQNPYRLTSQATELYQSGNWQPAAKSWQQAADMFASQADKLNQAMALSNLSLTYQQLGKWQEAKKAIAESVSILKNQPHSDYASAYPTDRQQLLLFQSLDIQGKLQQELGQYQSALATWQQAEKIQRQLGDRSNYRNQLGDRLLQNQINQVESMQSLGYYPLACKTLLKFLNLESSQRLLRRETTEPALTVGECRLPQDYQTIFDQPLSVVEAKALFSLADVLRVTGNLDQSKAILEQTLQSKKAISAPIKSKALLSLAKTEQALSRSSTVDSEAIDKHLENALIYYQQAVNKANEPLVNAQILLEQLNLLLDRGRTKAAANLLPKIDKYLSQSRLTSQAIYTQVNLAKSLVWLQQQQTNTQFYQSNNRLLSPAERLLTKAVAQAQEIADIRAESYATGSLGGLYEYQQQDHKARQQSDRALKLAQAVQAKELAYQWDWQLARLLKATDTSAAMTYYAQAYNILDDLRTDLIALNPEIRFSFRENIEPIYREYVDLLLLAPQPNQTNLKQAREVIEALQLAELDNFFQDTCLETQPVTIDNLQPNAAIFYSIMLPDRLETITAFPGEPLRNYKQKLPQAEIEQKITALMPQLSVGQYKNPQPKPELLTLLHQFYDWFIQPIEAELSQKNIQTLVFISDSFLRNIPPASFYDGDRYLIEQYNIAVAPSLQLTDPQFLDRQESQVFTAGISEARQGFDELPGIESEITSIQKTFPADTLLNQSFTQLNFSSKLQSLPYQIVHIATHGQFSSQAEDTFILAWDEKISVNELGSILRSQQLQTDRPIELLVLSACETAKGDNLATLGIAGVAVRAGARSTLASLWSVDDEATMKLMTYFYQELAKENVSKAEALRRAQIKTLQQEIYSHPYFWSAFTLVGNWL